jgi:2-desacetyl-2-hydroxyethyl bacteriochlorophyllide A dehydrogenase
MMKIVVCERPGVLTVGKRDSPARAAGEVLVRIRRVGMCGTDYHIFRGTQPYLTYPRVMGHELAGEVAEADSESGFRPGQTVCIMPYLSCGRCRACLGGKTNCCCELQVLGVHRDGGLAEFLSVPNAFVIDARGLSLDQAAMVEFLSIGHHAVSRGDPRSGEQVLVAGAGPIGMAVTLFAARRGAQVTVMDAHAPRAEFCVRELGATRTLAVDDAAGARIAQLTDGDGFDTVFDATGNPAAMEAGFSYVAHGGTYVLVSVVSSDISFSDPEFHKRETSLLASRNATIEDFRAVVDTIRKGYVPTDKLHTHRTALEELPDVVEAWTERSTGVIKGIVELN